MLKAVHIIGGLDLGGAEVLVRDLHKKWDKPFESHIMYHTDGKLLNGADEKSKKFTFNKLKLSTIRALRAYIRHNEIDIIHVHSVVNPLKLIPALVFSKVKTVFSVHGYSLNSRKFTKWIAFSFFDSVLFVSNTLKNAYIGNSASSKDKFRVLHNGIESAKFNIKSDRFRSELSIPINRMLMGFVGNFNTVRDQLTVCKALKLLKENGIDFTFLFVGAAHIQKLYDECFNYCKEQGLLENVKFLGSRNDVPEILSSLDLFVYSSNHDTFGIAVVEAMMSETPVVVNDLNVFTEITDGGRYACLYKSKDEADLAREIEKLIQNPDERKSLGLKGKKWAEDNFSIEAHIDQLNELYSDLLQK